MLCGCSSHARFRNILVFNLSAIVSPARFQVIHNPSAKCAKQLLQRQLHNGRTYATLFLDAIESEKPDILKLGGSNMKLLDHLITLHVLSKMRVFISDMPSQLYEGNVRSSYILEFFVAANFTISQTYLDCNTKRKIHFAYTFKWIITAEQHWPASF